MAYLTCSEFPELAQAASFDLKTRQKNDARKWSKKTLEKKQRKYNNLYTLW
jgi:hypothetical protein